MAVLLGIGEEPRNHFHGAVVEDTQQDLPGLGVRGLGDQGVERRGCLQQFPIHQFLEGAEILDQAGEALHRIGAVIRDQVLELLGLVGVGDERRIAG